jgi:hypothetical protein
MMLAINVPIVDRDGWWHLGDWADVNSASFPPLSFLVFNLCLLFPPYQIMILTHKREHSQQKLKKSFLLLFIIRFSECSLSQKQRKSQGSRANAYTPDVPPRTQAPWPLPHTLLCRTGPALVDRQNCSLPLKMDGCW